MFSVMFPTAAMGMCGMGPLMAFRYSAPIRPAGKSFTASAPAAYARATSVGVSAPGIAVSESSFARAISRSSVFGATMNSAPAIFAVSSCSTVITVPAPSVIELPRASRSAHIDSAVSSKRPFCTNVTSSARTPPRISACATPVSLLAGTARSMANILLSIIASSVFILNPPRLFYHNLLPKQPYK